MRRRRPDVRRSRRRGGGVARVDAAAPADSAARGPTSGRAKAFERAARGPARIVHQADRIAPLFSGRYVSDANNALKTGYDPIDSVWPDVFAPGATAGPVTREAALRFGLARRARVGAGTTDALRVVPGHGRARNRRRRDRARHDADNQATGRKPIFAPECGVYSHRFWGCGWSGARPTAAAARCSPFQRSGDRGARPWPPARTRRAELT